MASNYDIYLETILMINKPKTNLCFVQQFICIIRKFVITQ